jgi:hypothetical protein
MADNTESREVESPTEVAIPGSARPEQGRPRFCAIAVRHETVTVKAGWGRR